MESENTPNSTPEPSETSPSQAPAQPAAKKSAAVAPQESGAAKAAKPVQKLEESTVRMFDYLLSFVRNHLSTDFFLASSNVASRIGRVTLYIAALIGFLGGSVYAIKHNSFEVFGTGLGWVLACLVVHYIATKFLPVGDLLVKSAPSNLSSRAFLECFGLLNFLLGILGFLGWTVIAIRAESIEYFYYALATLVVCEYIVCLCLNPKLLTIEIEESTSAGEEAIGILAFLIKGLVRLVPIAFGVGIVVGTLLLFVAFIQTFGDNPLMAYANGTFAGASVLNAALLPFLSYVFFVLSYLIIDVIRSILSIPRA